MWLGKYYISKHYNLYHVEVKTITGMSWLGGVSEIKQVVDLIMMSEMRKIK